MSGLYIPSHTTYPLLEDNVQAMPPNYGEDTVDLKNVTALEAFALASALVTIIAQGDPKVATAITDLAGHIFNEIMGISDGQPDTVEAPEENPFNDDAA